jgi:hypothetical protein
MKWFHSSLEKQEAIVLGRIPKNDEAPTNILLDVYNHANAQYVTGANRRILDNGAYALHKQGMEQTPAAWLLGVQRALQSWNADDIEFIVGPDVVGDPDASHKMWLSTFNARDDLIVEYNVDTIPVWQWGGSWKVLGNYLDLSRVVGIGGCVQWMRDQNHENLERLVEMLEADPGRYHIFGLNWIRAINEVAPYAYSADSSKWIDAARYGHKLHIVNGDLVATSDILSGMTRNEMLMHYAQTLNEWAHKYTKQYTPQLRLHSQAVPPPAQTPSPADYTLF